MDLIEVADIRTELFNLSHLINEVKSFLMQQCRPQILSEREFENFMKPKNIPMQMKGKRFEHIFFSANNQD